ncbi:hypothetical protein QQ045_000653 [Rhodiola kirilowii]
MECKYEMHHKNQRKLESEDFTDDDFYAEIRLQILLLTADDDDEEHVTPRKLKKMPCGSRNSISTTHKGTSHQLGWWESNQAACSAPAWMITLWRSHGNTSGGTGVFIPQIVKSRRKHRPTRRRSLVMGT